MKALFAARRSLIAKIGCANSGMRTANDEMEGSNYEM